MTGQYAHNIDAKGRLFIPAKLREELGQTFHVTIGLDHCLSIYSNESWDAFMDKLRDLPYSKAKVWPASGGVNANCWVFARWSDGQWYAATFEYLRSGQTAKPMSVLSGGGHIKVSPLSGWRPKSGERIGLMVSGLARTTMRNVKERSNVVMVTWP